MPITFEIYRHGERVTEFTPIAATPIGPESVAIPGEVTFRDGLLRVHRSEDAQPAGVSLLWDCGPPGEFMLETTRLQPRAVPYLLNVELARFRLMKIVQKQEDWNLFDFPKADALARRFREAQDLFADALGNLQQAAMASQLGDEALEIAIDVSEQLANFHADLLFNRRRSSGGLVRHIFGCRADPASRSERMKESLAGHFDYGIVPMGWKQLQPTDGAFDCEPVDEWVEYLVHKRLPVIAGPLISFDTDHVPEWMFVWENDFDTLREMAYEYVHKVVGRYRKHVAMWNVVAGLHKRGVFRLTFEQVIELTRLLVAHVKTVLPGARTLVTVTHPFGEYTANSTSSVPPNLYAEMITQAGVSFEAFGLELEMGVPTSGKFSRDLFQLSCLLDKFSTLGRPLFLTAVCVPGRSTPDSADTSEGRLDPSHAGRWRRPWDAKMQADWMAAVYHLALSKPFVESVAWSNLADTRPSMPAGGLLDDLLKPKLSFAKLQEMRHGIKNSGKKV